MAAIISVILIEYFSLYWDKYATIDDWDIS